MKEKKSSMKKIERSEQEWQTCLTPDEYRVLREKGTERAFTGKYYNFKEIGTYTCAACGNELFSSETKFDSGTGWPSFFKPLADSSVSTDEDRSFGMKRIEVHCNQCGSHLGHVFDDAPQMPTGLRYCINSVSLNFVPSEKATKK